MRSPGIRQLPSERLPQLGHLLQQIEVAIEVLAPSKLLVRAAAEPRVGRRAITGVQHLLAPRIVDLDLTLDHRHPRTLGTVTDGEDRALDRDQAVVGRYVEPPVALWRGFDDDTAALYPQRRPRGALPR